MKFWHSLYQLTRADFFERTRRYSFLITIGLALYIAYIYLPPISAGYMGFALGDVRGVYNSAWIGSVIAVLCSTLLIVPGFYLVKNSILRDLDTRVGEIIATTPVSKWGYVAGKTLSNFAYMVAMVAVIAAAGIAMQLIRGEDLRIEIWPYLSPFLFSTLPAVFLISALAVLFETVFWLRGGFGNFVFAFLWLVVLITSISLSESSGRLRPVADPLGMTTIVYSMLESARAHYPNIESGFAIGGVRVQGPVQTFAWDGMQWSARAALGRMAWIGVGIGFSLLGAGLFNRFDPASERGIGKKSKKVMQEEVYILPEVPAPVSLVHLTPLESRRGNFLSLFWRMLFAELRLMFRGINWWWYLVALGLVIGCLFTPLQISRHYLLPAAYVWPVLLWSTMGNREARYNTQQLIFSSTRSIRFQLSAAWCAGWIVALLTGSGLAVRLLAAGQKEALFAWLIGSLFIPSLAQAMGIWSGSSKLFEVVYILLWYAGPINQVAALDYMGVSNAAVTSGIPLVYLMASIVLMGLSILGRLRQPYLA